MTTQSNKVLGGCYALATFSGMLLAMSYAMHPFWWAAWLAPAPIIVATLRMPAMHRRGVTLLAGFIGGISSFSYHLTIGGWPVAILILVLVALAWSSAVRLAVGFAERQQLTLALLVVPVTWAAIDTLLIHFSPHGSAGSIAYSQMNALPVIQVASLGGIPAVTFTVLLAGSLLGLFFGRAIDPDRRGHLAASALAVLAIGAILSFGSARLNNADTLPGPSVALIAMDGLKEQPSSYNAFWQIYGSQITRVVRPDAIVVLPEAVLSLSEPAADDAARSLATIASQTRSTIVVGMTVEGAHDLTGRALIARPDGTYRWYLKQHLIPGIEADITPGSVPFVIPDQATTIGIAICKDMHFPTLAREYSQRGARLMLVPANDFEVDDWLTARMTVLRGVESGSTIARAARHGFSFVSDRYGRVTAERRSDTTMGALLSRAPIDPGGSTVYARIGDVFGWACVLAWAFLLAFRFGLFGKLFGRNRIEAIKGSYGEHPTE